jgi:DNA-binding XRE family transcriptional regulator
MVQEKLRSKRESLGLSRDKLARLAEITTQTIYRAETSGKITLQNYLKITETLEKYGRKSKTSTSANVRTNNSSDSNPLPVSDNQGETNE